MILRNSILLISSVLLVIISASCNRKQNNEVTVVEDVFADNNEPVQIAPDYDEVWMMQGWDGYMGVFIGFRDGKYDHIYSSDAGGTPPLYTGNYTRNRSGLTLHVHEDESTPRFYSQEWKFVREDGKLRLAAVDDLKHNRDSGRWLRKVNLSAYKYLYDPQDHFILRSNPNIEAEFTLRDRLAEQDAAPNPLTVE